MVGLLFIFLEILSLIAILEWYVRKILSVKPKFWSRQDKILEILVLSEDSFITDDLFPVQ